MGLRRNVVSIYHYMVVRLLVCLCIRFLDRLCCAFNLKWLSLI